MNFEEKVGFNVVRERIKSHCVTAYAKQRVDNEEIATNAATIERRLSLTDELRVISMFETRFPQGEFTDCTTFLPSLQATFSCISLENLRRLSTLMQNLRQITSFLQSSKPEQYPALREMAKNIQYFPEISRRIDTILDKNGDIKPSASPELEKICSQLQGTLNSIGRKVQSILEKAKSEGVADTDAQVSVRDGKLLIPVNSYNKRGVQGIVQGASASGKTYFIEPLEVIEMNNRVRELEYDRQREIERLLMEFTDFLRPYVTDVLEGARFIGELDFILAKAVVARQIQAGKPILSDEGELKIYKGRHPVLESALAKEKKAIVPIDLELNRHKHILIISGPNAGGKSVCLKTVGILQYMLQWGMLVPCSEVSEFPIMTDFFIDIGDDQSIENDLSTYSSHLLNMRQLLKLANENTLVLIDEFGSGTEPTAGGAIAETILEELETRKVYGVITTHYTNLKVYAEKSEGVINGAMQFDSVHIQPLYKLEMGVPGNSFAFDLARKMGLPEQIVKAAEEKAGENFIDLERQLRKISRNRKKLDEKLAHIKLTDRNLESITERYSGELSKIKETKKEILDAAKKEAEELLKEANKKIEATIKAIKESQAQKEKTKQVRDELSEFKQSLDSKGATKQDAAIEAKMEQLLSRKKRQEERKARRGGVAGAAVQDADSQKVITLEVGGKARVEGSSLVGQVMALDDKWVSLSVGEIISKVRREKVTPISNKEFEGISATAIKPVRQAVVKVDESIDKRKLEFRTELDIRGFRLSEALDAVARYIDDASLVGVGQVRILHGKGTGVLREEIRNYLKHSSSVTDFHDEDVRFGGSGITVVSL